ncbi:AAA family ATPase [Aromatoleum bremense]|uniref:AAA family ATPase n=1 Tax=Aromatoleum bremense TaxID=76115 RepID=A0ABX1NX04_9RHOO|nr:AAA family ATPase [Aromatoleum bremense]NMG16418.1 AAA family ATPase [Aromatoleum bremense]QTQ31626.1 Putative ATP-binding protein [Aromatoleum bremense]
MRLSKLRLSNFRSFERLELDLHPRLTVLVGENGAGKTAVLDAIAGALSPVLTYLSSANQRLTGRGIQDADFRVVQWPQFGGKARWGMADVTQLQVETVDGLAWDVWRASTKGKKPEHSIGQTELKQRLQGISDSYASDRPRLTPVMAYYGARRGYIEVPQRLRAAKVNYGYPAAALFGALDSMSDFREMLAWFDQEEAAELRANKGVAGEDFTESPNLIAVRTAIGEMLGGAYSNPHFNRDHKFVLERKADGAHLLVNQLSQGYQSMLALAMDFARRLSIANPQLQYGSVDFQAQFLDLLEEADQLHVLSACLEPVNPFQQALAMGAPAIMLVDEIDLHLHPTWQQRVLGDLMRTFPLTQFIVTTHSPQVLTTVSRDNIRILQYTETGFEASKPDFSPLAHESGDALAKVMGTQREPELPLQDDIRRYEQLVRTGQEPSPDAQKLRDSLENAGYQFHDSDLATWRFLAARKLGKAG